MLSESDKLLAKGYNLHDGGPRPRELTVGSFPGVSFNDGSFIRQGEVRAELIDWSRVRGWKTRDYQFLRPGLAFHGKRP